jgi:hypothetical protein
VVRRAAAIWSVAVLAAALGLVFFSFSASGSPVAARGGVRLLSSARKGLKGRWQAWADASLVPTVAGRVTLTLSGCPALPKAAGCVYVDHPRVVYLKNGLVNPRAVLLHELGHVYDLTVLNDSDRADFRKIFHIPASRAWWSGKIPPAEWFAEGYSWCARYKRIVSVRRYAIYHYDPTPTEHSRLCALIKRAARDSTPPKAPPAPPILDGDPAPTASPPVSPDTVPGDPTRDSGPSATERDGTTPVPTSTPTPTATRGASSTPAPTPSPRPTRTPRPSPTPTHTPTPTATPTDTPTATPTSTPTASPTPGDDQGEDPTPTPSSTPVP